MSDTPHTLTLTIKPHNGIYAVWTCTAPEGAPCRLTCPEGCEEWGKGHEHELVDDGHCLATEWIENGDAEWYELFVGPPAPLRSGPVVLTWNGIGYVWRYPS